MPTFPARDPERLSLFIPAAFPGCLPRGRPAGAAGDPGPPGPDRRAQGIPVALGEKQKLPRSMGLGDHGASGGPYPGADHLVARESSASRDPCIHLVPSVHTPFSVT